MDLFCLDACQELLAVDAVSLLLQLPDSPQALLADGQGVEIEVGVPYAEALAEDAWSTAHQRAHQFSGLARSGGGWIALACWSVLPDRHWAFLIRRMARAHDAGASTQIDG